jgi:hypothetical protein
LFTREPKFSICRKNTARNFLRRWSFNLCCRDARADFPGTDLESIWRLKPEARTQFQTIGRGASAALMTIVATGCGFAAVGLARNREWGRRLAIGILIINLIGDLLNALFMHDAKTLIGLPIGGLMILFLVRTKRSAR